MTMLETIKKGLPSLSRKKYFGKTTGWSNSLYLTLFQSFRSHALSEEFNYDQDKKKPLTQFCRASNTRKIYLHF